MAYNIPATSKTPALIIYLLDVSGSMGDEIDGKPKIEIISDALHQVAERSTACPQSGQCRGIRVPHCPQKAASA